MLFVMAAFAVAMTWQLKTQIAAFHDGALKEYESALTARGSLNEAHALAYRTLTWSANLGKDELQELYAGVTFFIKPVFNFDQRTPETGQVRSRH